MFVGVVLADPYNRRVVRQHFTVAAAFFMAFDEYYHSFCANSTTFEQIMKYFKQIKSGLPRRQLLFKSCLQDLNRSCSSQ